MEPQVFLLSPASCSGQRARLLLSERAEFALARRLRSPAGATLGEAFSFLSGLYFRGKLTYARAFCRPPVGPACRAGPWAALSRCGILVITAGRGLVPADTSVRLEDLEQFAAVPIDPAEPRYAAPLQDSAAALAEQLGPLGRAVLLGSIATDKYTGILSAALGDRLLFPQAFVGRGDMSRGGLLLRCVDDGRELDYLPLGGAIRRGRRPARLLPRVAGGQEDCNAAIP